MVSIDLMEDDDPIDELEHDPAVQRSPRVEGELPQIRATIVRVRASENSAITRTNNPLNETNWTVWRKKITYMLEMCGVDEYVRGVVKQPNRDIDLEGARAWAFNDTYAKLLITNNIEPDQMIHINQCNTSHEMWECLEAVHESRGHQTIISYIRNLIHTIANEDDNINDHLVKLKRYWERINQIADDDLYKFSDSMFKVIISSSLPPTWDTFMEPYVGGQIGTTDNDQKRRISSQKLIGLIKEEYFRREQRKHPNNESTHIAYNRNSSSYKSLATRITTGKPGMQSKPPSNLYCRHCKLTNHTVENCHNLGKNSCDSCGRFGHARKDCRKNNGNKRKRESDSKSPNKGGANKRFRYDETKPTANVEQTHFITFNAVEDPIRFSPADEGQYFNFDSENVSNADVTMNDERVIYYDWLADSATTSHICNARDAFITYHPIDPTPVVGVGNIKAHAKGRGSVQIQSHCNGHTYILQLEDVLHVPGNRNNLISLGRWDKDGRQYIGQNNTITLFTKEGKSVARGTKIANNLQHRKSGKLGNMAQTVWPYKLQWFATPP